MLGFIKPIARLVPYQLRPILKEKYYDFMLGVDHLLGKKYGMIPPTRMNFVGTRTDFVEVGKEFLGHFRNYCQLQPSDKVLDIGSGIGRMAIPLTEYLDSQGRYEGFDLVSYGVKWCQNKITSKHPNFRFQQADVHNHAYHPSGKVEADVYQFPFLENTFTFAFATSVFTHLMRPASENYLREIARVLAPGGKALLTFFILNDESRRLIESKKSNINFYLNIDGAWTNDPDNPEWAIAFEEDYIRAFLNKIGLELQSIELGSWCGRANGISYQDLLILKKI